MILRPRFLDEEQCVKRNGWQPFVFCGVGQCACVLLLCGYRTVTDSPLKRLFFAGSGFKQGLRLLELTRCLCGRLPASSVWVLLSRLNSKIDKTLPSLTGTSCDRDTDLLSMVVLGSSDSYAQEPGRLDLSRTMRGWHGFLEVQEEPRS